ncbi:PaaI family thioesterase [Motilimonas cestriensis]|uniref:Acyl-coenzyme A thioesterase THEM4 n=1 Tax=Motilimonas cestriensis TaxID=2742685 RepID=A0ABS8W9E0_9GAMM|nr:PaaI family thioesterase [Motilimonas cestriensis]MCE2594333.1 PaaI family thioesterase [Motilimonas cestriensis]
MSSQLRTATATLQNLIKHAQPNDSGQQLLPVAKQPSHQHCVLCSPNALMGLKLNFFSSDNSVWAHTKGSQHQQGYQDIIHGGVLAALVDATMCQTLFSHEITAVTAEMCVRYLHPVPVGSEILMQGSLVTSHPPLFNVQAKLFVNGQLVVKARAKFFQSKAR